MLVKEGIRVANDRVSVEGLHEDIRGSVRAFLNDPDVFGRAWCSSGDRTEAQQRWLFESDDYYAADPDEEKPSGIRGSWHMRQKDGRAYAVDLSQDGTIPAADWTAFLARHGLDNIGRTFGDPTDPDTKHRYEPWHCVSTLDSVKADLGKLKGWKDKGGFRLPDLSVAPGATGESVKEMTRLLCEYGWLDQTGDTATKPVVAAVKRFQKASGLAADGICGPMTWQALTKPDAARSPKPARHAKLRKALAPVMAEQSIAARTTKPAKQKKEPKQVKATPKRPIPVPPMPSLKKAAAVAPAVGPVGWLAKETHAALSHLPGVHNSTLLGVSTLTSVIGVSLAFGIWLARKWWIQGGKRQTAQLLHRLRLGKLAPYLPDRLPAPQL